MAVEIQDIVRVTEAVNNIAEGLRIYDELGVDAQRAARHNAYVKLGARGKLLFACESFTVDGFTFSWQREVRGLPKPSQLVDVYHAGGEFTVIGDPMSIVNDARDLAKAGLLSKETIMELSE